MSKLVIGDRLPSKLIRSQFVIKCIFKPHDTNSLEEFYFFPEGAEEDVLLAAGLLEQYLNDPRIEDPLFEQEFSSKLRDPDYQVSEALDAFLEDLFNCWPEDRDGLQPLSAFYIFFYDEEGNAYDVKIME